MNINRQPKCEMETSSVPSKNRSLKEIFGDDNSLIKTIFDNTPNPLVLKDTNGIYQAINSAFCKFVGKVAEEIIGKTDYDLFPAEEAEQYVIGDKAVMADGEQQKEEWEVSGSDGKRWLKVVKTPVTDAAGTTSGVLCTVTDVTEIVLANMAKEKENVRLRAVLGAIGENYWDWDIKTGRVRFSPQWLASLGYEEGEVPERVESWEELLHPKDRRRVMKVLQEHFEGRTSVYEVENRLRMKSGEYRWNIDRGKIIEWDADGKPARMVGCDWDNSERKSAEKKLQENEERYRNLFHNNHAVMLLIDPDTGDVVDANPAAADFYGWSREELVCKKITDINAFAPDDVLGEMRLAKEAKKKCFHFRHKRADGSLCDVEVYSGKITLHSRDMLYSIIHDISKRKKAEDALRESEKNMRSILDSLPDPVYKVSDEFCIEYMNPAMITMLGRDMTGEVCYFSVRGCNETCPWCIMGQIQRGAQVQYELNNPFGHGNRYSIHNVPVLNSDGSISKITTYHDITELVEYREKLEKQVQERTDELNRSLYDTEKARDRISTILQSMADGLIVTDRYNRVILMNPAAEDLLGVRLNTVVGCPVTGAIQDRTLRERIRETFDRQSNGDQFDFELPGTDPHLPRVMRARTSIIKHSRKIEAGTVTIISDVTHEREVDRMKSEFVSTAAHELRTPLASILGFSEILLTRDTLKQGERTKFLMYINSQASVLADIVSDMLDVSRLESGQGFSIKVQSCDVGDIIRSAIIPFRSNNSHHCYEWTLPDSKILVNADPEKLGQVIKNLVSNATKYSPDGGPVRVTGRVLADNYLVSVEDEGIGMVPEQVEKVFDKFYRADASNSAIEGTGLGMTIVKHIVEAHGGRVWVESKWKKGTVVMFSLPVASKDA